MNGFLPVACCLSVLAFGMTPFTDSTVWGQLLNSGIILVIGGFGLRVLFKLKDDFKDHLKAESEAAQLNLDSLREEVAEAEGRTNAALDKELMIIREFNRNTEKTVAQLSEAILGSVINPEGLLKSVRRDRMRRHDLTMNMEMMADKQVLMTDLLLDIAKSQNISVSPHVVERMKRPLEWTFTKGEG